LRKARSETTTLEGPSGGRKTLNRNSTWTNVLRDHPELKRDFQRAIDQVTARSFAKAIEILVDLIGRFPDQAPVYWYLGGIYFHDLDSPKKAVPLFRTASKLSPRWEKASLGLFHSLWSLGREKAALKELLRFQALSNCPDYEEILAEVQEKAPELLKPKRKTTVATSNP
jgi:tetratricopeptide (TPR) repeat protein